MLDYPNHEDREFILEKELNLFFEIRVLTKGALHNVYRYCEENTKNYL